MKCVSTVIKTDLTLCDTGYLSAVRDRMKCVSAVIKTDLSVSHWLFECSER